MRRDIYLFPPRGLRFVEFRACFLYGSRAERVDVDVDREMNALAVMMLLVAGAVAAEDHAGHAHGTGKEECSCAQHEADHPFTINCDDGPAIRAATLTLESEACEKPRPLDTFEWGGAFETPGNSYKWVSQAASGEEGAKTYADPAMKMVLFSVDEADVTHLFEQAATANTLMTTGSCPVKNSLDSIPKPTAAGACYTLTFPTNAADNFHATIDTTGVGHVAFFTAHMPTEFERDTHYLMDGTCADAAAMASATGGATVANCAPAEPKAQNKEYCKIQADANGLMTCQQAFFVIQAHHDYCPHDTLTSYEEKLFHDWESKCKGCLIRRKHDPALNSCPVVDCEDATVADLSYTYLNEKCVAANTDYAFEWGAVFTLPANSYKWVSQAATGTASAETYADAEMKMVLYSMTEAAQSTLFMKKDSADELMTTGSCPVKNSGESIPAPTAAGACYTLTFPTTNPSTTDFHLTIDTTGVGHVAFFTAHMPTEFERDTHYLMDGTCANAADMASATGGATVANCAPAEPVEALGAEAAHDHGRRLAVATKGAKGVTNRKSIGKRRLVNDGTCCTDSAQKGAWKQVVAYHDLCEHDQVPEEIEKGFHDYEASCEAYFCNLIGPDVDQTKCVPKVGETTYTNCGVTTTLAKTPERVVALHQGSIEFMLAMGLEDKMVGTASMDDEIWPRYKEAYDKIKKLTPSGLPSETEIMAVQPDFIIGAYRSAFAEMRCDAGENCRTDDSHGGIFSDATVGPCDGENSDYFPAGNASVKTSYSTCRPQLNANGIGTWLWVDCTPLPASTHTAPSLHTHGPHSLHTHAAPAACPA